MNYKKSAELAKKFKDEGDFSEHEALLNYEDLDRPDKADRQQEWADRYHRAANYLDNRAKRAYGTGHDMSVHGEGKGHGEK